MGARDRAKRDRADGDLGSARRRLMSLHDQQGYDPRLCREIGMLCTEMNDPEEAGRWLLMSDLAPGSSNDAAIARFFKSCSHDQAVILQRLPRAFKRVEFKALPKVVQERLGGVGIDRLSGPSQRAVPMRPLKLLDKLVHLGCSLIMVLLLLSTVVGLVTIVGWLVEFGVK